jgi:hypothetical protein
MCKNSDELTLVLGEKVHCEHVVSTIQERNFAIAGLVEAGFDLLALHKVPGAILLANNPIFAKQIVQSINSSYSHVVQTKGFKTFLEKCVATCSVYPILEISKNTEKVLVTA